MHTEISHHKKRQKSLASQVKSLDSTERRRKKIERRKDEQQISKQGNSFNWAQKQLWSYHHQNEISNNGTSLSLAKKGITSLIHTCKNSILKEFFYKFSSNTFRKRERVHVTILSYPKNVFAPEPFYFSFFFFSSSPSSAHVNE